MSPRVPHSPRKQDFLDNREAGRFGDFRPLVLLFSSVWVNVHVEARGQLRLWWLRRHPPLYISDLSMEAGSPGGPELIKLAKLAGQ